MTDNKRIMVRLVAVYPFSKFLKTFRSQGGVWVWVYWGLTPQQQPGSYQGGEMMMMIMMMAMMAMMMMMMMMVGADPFGTFMKTLRSPGGG